MDSVTKFLQPLQLHPVVDHFSMALLIVAVLIDLVASAAPTRIWLRYAALLLIILGALAAGGSYFTGGMEADRIWNALGPPAKDVLKKHAELGEYLAITFGVLALWRIMIEGFGFMAGSRAIYLIVAFVAIVVLGYQGHLGGVLVFDYGAGTALMAAAPVPSEAASPSSAPTSSGAIPMVSVPTPIATSTPPPAIPATSASKPTDSPKPGNTPASSPTAQPSATPSGGAAM
ncbi:DUF2231 domain-containing protein [Candidatus Binatus sp.]|jgi:uncharacterized membrane protein|uniref:DUF2231 domain-containing protein n=1 Tax=Candidatus Binatus sp. TaxID=2811406 RepID=UPI003BBE8A89